MNVISTPNFDFIVNRNESFSTVLEEIKFKPNTNTDTIYLPDGINEIKLSTLLQLNSTSIKKVIMSSDIRFILAKQEDLNVFTHFPYSLDFTSINHECILIDEKTFTKKKFQNVTYEEIIINSRQKLNILSKNSQIKKLVIKETTTSGLIYLADETFYIDKLVAADGVKCVSFHVRSEPLIGSISLPYSVKSLCGFLLKPNLNKKGYFKCMNYNEELDLLSCKNQTISKTDFQPEIKKIELCKTGYHFCYQLPDVLLYFFYNSNTTKIAEIEIGIDVDISAVSNKGVTNTYRIKKIFSHNEFIDYLNHYSDQQMLIRS